MAIAASVHLNGINRDVGGLGVVAEDPLPRIDLRSVAVPAVLGIEAVGKQDQGVLVSIVRVLGGRIERGRQYRASSTPRQDQ